MQNLKEKFRDPDLTLDGSVQTCIRTSDLDLVGDGSHLTSFQMIGNFSFGRNDFPKSIKLWSDITRRLEIEISHVTIHPTREDHRKEWETLGYDVREDPDCSWTDGDIGGECTEMFNGDLEIGNLVNTRGTSTDVGFGLERMLQVMEGKGRVDETSLFDQSLPPVVRDHTRTLYILWKQNVPPGGKGRNYICRRLIRRILPLLDENVRGTPYLSWIEDEKRLRDRSLRDGRRLMRRHHQKDEKWWWETCGLVPEEVQTLRNER